MAINVVWNRQSGPGGGTRRLHHDEERVDKINSFFDIRLKFNQLFFWGRNRIDACSKDSIFARHDIHRYRVNVVVANDNTAPVAMAA